METNNTNQQPQPSPSLPQTQSSLSPNSNQEGNFLIPIGVIFLILIVGAGAYYLGTKNVRPTTNNQSQQINNEQNATSSPSETVVPPTANGNQKSLKTETLQIKKETAVNGNETVNISLQLPSDWNLQTVNHVSNPNNLIKNCADYVITSSDKITTLTISPICTGWSATYKPWPSNTIIVKDEGKVGNDGHPAAIVRYYGLHANTFIYSEGFKSENQVQDALMIYYGDNFIPANVSVNATDVSPDIKNTDQIVASIKAS